MCSNDSRATLIQLSGWVLLAVVLLTAWRGRGAPSVPGKIVRPFEALPGALFVRVVVGDVPLGYHLWLAVEADGRYWPREPVLPSCVERWRAVVPVGAGHEKKTVSLWLVPPCGHLRLRDWCRQAGPDTRPGLPEMPGATRLDTVKVDVKLRGDAIK